MDIAAARTTRKHIIASDRGNDHRKGSRDGGVDSHRSWRRRRGGRRRWARGRRWRRSGCWRRSRCGPGYAGNIALVVSVDDTVARDDIAIVTDSQCLLVHVRAVDHAIGGKPCRNRLRISAGPAHGMGFVDHEGADGLSGNDCLAYDHAAVGIHASGNGCELVCQLWQGDHAARLGPLDGNQVVVFVQIVAHDAALLRRADDRSAIG